MLLRVGVREITVLDENLLLLVLFRHALNVAA